MAEFVPITAKAFREGGKHKPGPHAVEARFDAARHRIVVELDTGLELAFDPARAHGLEHASAAELAGVAVAGAGSALHVPALDAYFTVARLLEGFLGPLDWSRREARAAASRANGALGGRPRKALLPA
ncbi:DUF2442 domain-containing protein [Sandarakinorhabdus sp.]|uniref:DUF2442 domain-containing protein n=1 Tax=Sandarakinorhabdus sp. TaxID=1916663 RepID=UPI003342B38E